MRADLQRWESGEDSDGSDEEREPDQDSPALSGGNLIRGSASRG